MFLNEVSLNVKPVFVNYSPICTADALTVLPKEDAKKSAEELMKVFNTLKGVNLLDPIMIESREDIENLGKKLRNDVDFILPHMVGPLYDEKEGRMGWRHSMATELELGDYNIPILKIAITVWDFAGLEVIAALRARGKKGYYSPTVEQMNKFLKVQRVKKALSKSRLLVFGRVHSRCVPLQESTISNIIDPLLIKDKTGIDVIYWPVEMVREDLKKVSEKEAEKIADKWIKEAEEVKPLFRKDEVDYKYIVNLAKLDIVIRNTMKMNSATAVANCEVAGALDPDAPPCITFTFLKEEGFPAVCEGDMNVAIPMIMLHYVANAPADMGNVLVNIEENMGDFKVPNPENDHTIIITHSVTPRNTGGYGSPCSGYKILGTHCSTCYGANTYVELPANQIVTLSRMNPNADRLLLIKGKILKSMVTHAEGNREVVYIEMDKGKKANDYMEKVAPDFGNHLTYVFGDHIEEMSKLCNELGIEPVVF